MYREIINLAKDQAVNGIVGAFTPTNAVKDEVFKFMRKIDGNFDENNSDQMAMGIRKTADALIGKGVDYLVKQYINTDILTQPVKPTMPTVTLSETRISGTINHSSTHDLQSTFTPGSFIAKGVDSDNIEEYNYPIYNKPTGLYALMKTPKVALGSKLSLDSLLESTKQNFVYSQWSPMEGIYGIFQQRSRTASFDFVAELSTSQNIMFHLDEKLVYKLNRNLDINDNKSNVLVSFQIELENKGEHYHYYGVDKVHQVDVSNTNFEILNHENFVQGQQKEKLILEIPWDKIENSGKMIYGGKIEFTSSFKYLEGSRNQLESYIFDLNTNQLINITYTNDDYIEFGTTVTEVAHAVPGQMIQPKVPRKDIEYTIKSVKMKVMVDLTFDQVSSKGGEINTTQVFTYLIYDPSNNIDLIESNGRWLTPQEIDGLSSSVSFPPTIHIGNAVLGPGSPFVTFVKGTELYVRADEIFINGTVSVMPGYTAVLYATEKIQMSQISTIHQNITLRIGDRFERFPFKGKTLEATNTQVNSFCSNNQEYKANQNALVIPNNDSTPPPVDIDIDINDEALKMLYAIKWSVYPNPNNGQFNIRFDQELPLDASVTVFDLTGRSVHNETIMKGSRQFEIKTNGLSSGIYMVTIIQGQEKQTVKLVVQ